MKKYTYILVLLVMILSGCKGDNEYAGLPIIGLYCKIYFEDQRINDSIAGLVEGIDYSVVEWHNPYTFPYANGDIIETKRLLSSLYTMDCTIDNGAEKVGGRAFLFDTDELSQKPYIILWARRKAPGSINTFDVTYQLCSEAIFGDENVYTISVKYYYNPAVEPALIQCTINGKPGKILDSDLNIMELKVFDD